ncbi:MAG: DUF4838 domain-containing protein [Kiritimatiellae bacterium]|nr:DUF4838 domain-containing protein [Kiritimatiellia bacterium]
MNTAKSSFYAGAEYRHFRGNAVRLGLTFLFVVLSVRISSASVVMPDEIRTAAGVRASVAEDGTVNIVSAGKAEEVTLVWRRRHAPETRIFRNDWERAYGESGWTSVAEDAGRGSAWYCLVKEDDGRTDGWGVAVQPNAFCWWQVSPEEIRLTIDVRAGARPVNLGGRTLKAAKLVMRRGKAGERPWTAARLFCRLMCPEPRIPKKPVYGYNDWYCAYGENTATNFLADAGLVVSLCEGLANRPYVVMDDGWQKNSPPVVSPLGHGASGWGPWDEAGDRFGMKMKPFAEAVARLGAKPGLWYRPYRAWDGVPEEMKLKARPICFDPSAKGVTGRLAADIARFRSWGMKLVKVDYMVADITGAMAFPRKVGGRPMMDSIVWRDESRTTCEVLLEQYRAMRQAAGDDMVLIACNAFDHLIAGIFDLQRTGGDTSGVIWGQTRKFGVNALSARSPHDKVFYAADADCVGLAWDGAVDWSLNRQWLDLVSRSGTPLFVSWRRQLATPPVRDALKKAFARASYLTNMTAEPLDWESSDTPREWRLVDGETVRYDWDCFSAMGPGKVVLATHLKDGKSLRKLYDRVHRLRGDYVVVPSSLRNAGNVAFGRARSSRTLGADEVPGIDERERFLDFSPKAPRTRGGELAHAIVAAVPAMVLACDPSVYVGNAAFKFVKWLPTVYDETRILPGGVVARRAGKVWYVACENGADKEKTVTVDLSFLGEGEKRLFAFHGKDGCENRKVRTSERLSFSLGGNDGFALRLTPPVTLFLAGDSTLSPRREWKPNGSWGEHLAPHLKDEVHIVDGAWGGRSTKSFRNGGHWKEEIAPYIGEGDWVMLQFGANDAVRNQPYRSCTPYEYSTNLVNYVNEVRAKGAEALICSPLAFRRYGGDGRWQEANGLQAYVDAAAKTAAELKVPYVDMAAISSRIIADAGFEKSRILFLCHFNGRDNVHPTKVGAAVFAKAFAEHLRARPENAASALIRPESGEEFPRIVAPVGQSLSAKLAVEELKRHLSGKADEAPYTFIFGKPADAPEAKAHTSHYRVRGKTVWFWGDDSGSEGKIDFGETRGHHPDPLRHGTLFAVELFAERELGYRWVWPGESGTAVKRVKRLELPERAAGFFETPMAMAHVRNYPKYGNVPWREVSGFMPHELFDTPYWTSFEERGIWQLRQRMQDRDIFRYGHAFADWQDRFEKTHPEYLALCFNPATGRSERGFTGPYRGAVKHCVASEGGVDQIVADWKAKGAPKYLNVCENDGTFWCECGECLALDVPRPSREDLKSNRAHLTDRYVNFWNRIAKKALAVRPDVMLVTYAYSAYRYPPRREKLEYPDNMLLGFVFGATDDWKGMLESWRAVGMRHFFNRPNHLHYTGSIPAGLARYFYDEFQGMRKYGMMGCDYDATGNRRQSGLEFYTIARLCANPDESFEKIFDDFCSVYGAAKDEVRAYYEMVERDGRKARDRAQRKGEGKVDDFDGEQPRKVPLLQAYGRNERELAEKRDFAAGIYARHRMAGDLTESELRSLKLLALDAEHAVLVFRFIDALESAPLDELKARADRLQAFRLDRYREMPDDYAAIYRFWWSEIQFWKHYNKRRAEGR